MLKHTISTLALTLFVLLTACGGAGYAGPPTAVTATLASTTSTSPLTVTTVAGAEAEQYTDPAGRFSLPVPRRWTVAAEDGYVTFTSSDRSATATIVVVPEREPSKAIADAWRRIQPAFDAGSGRVVEKLAPEGVERRSVVEYPPSPDGERREAIALLFRDSSYVALLRGSSSAFDVRRSQLDHFRNGITIIGIPRQDLSAVKPRTMDGDRLVAFERYVSEAMQRYGTPGAAVAIVQNGKVVFRKSFGVRKLGSPEPVTPDTLMAIGSTTKSMTTMLLASLVDEGLIGWDTRVVDVLPQFKLADPALTQRMTLRDLVCNCSGIPRHDDEFNFNARELRAEGLIGQLAAYVPAVDQGEAFLYSNHLIATAGYLGAATLGTSWGQLSDGYAQAMQRRIFAPIGMAHTTFSFDDVTRTGNYALPHIPAPNSGWRPASLKDESTLVPVAPAGGAWSNIDDMSRYLQTVMGHGHTPEGKTVASAEQMQTIWTPQIRVDGRLQYGLGWIVGDFKGQPILSHGGRTTGFSSDMAFLPRANLGIVVLSNQFISPLPEALRDRLFELAFDQPQSLDSPIAVESVELHDMFHAVLGQTKPVDPDVAKPYLGTYHNAKLGDVTFTLDDGKLIMDIGEYQAELRGAPQNDGTYIGASGQVMLGGIEFSRNDAGAITMRYGAWEFAKTQ